MAVDPGIYCQFCPAGFVNFTGRARQALLFVGRGSLFFCRVSIPDFYP